MGIDKPKVFEKKVQTIGGKFFLLSYFNHPGLLIMGRTISEKLLTRIRRKELEKYDEEWNIDISNQKTALCIYANKWECFKQLVRAPEPDKLAGIVQLRGKTNEERLFFRRAATQSLL